MLGNELLCGCGEKPIFTVTPGGRKIWLHKSGKAVCLEYTDPTGKHKLAVALARDRAPKAWAPSCTDVADLDNYKLGIWFSRNMTDTEVDARLGSGDRRSAKFNTDVLLSIGSEAATFARSVKIGGLACDVPNINQLIRIWVEGPSIDMLDHTLKSYPANSLEKWEFSNGHPSAWASTEYDKDFGNAMRYNGVTHSDTQNKTQALMIIPVREL